MRLSPDLFEKYNSMVEIRWSKCAPEGVSIRRLLLCISSTLSLNGRLVHEWSSRLWICFRLEWFLHVCGGHGPREDERSVPPGTASYRRHSRSRVLLIGTLTLTGCTFCFSFAPFLFCRIRRYCPSLLLRVVQLTPLAYFRRVAKEYCVTSSFKSSTFLYDLFKSLLPE